MADEKRLKELRAGSASWNAYRQAHRNDDVLLGGADLAGTHLTGADLTGADLAGTDLTGADLAGTDLTGADLTGADLSDAGLTGADLTIANLTGANLTRADLTRAGLPTADLTRADLTRADLSDADLAGANLTGANLTGANLTGAYLAGADLSDADLTRANLTGANLTGANLTDASLTNANLTRANLTRAGLGGADLTGADLTGADLIEVVFYLTNLRSATLAGAKLNWVALSGTLLLGVDLTGFCDGWVIHRDRSIVDDQSIAKSLRAPGLARFLVATGMPQLLVDYTIDSLRALDPNGLFSLMHSTFISYGGPDEAFARRLNEALLKNGVTTFFFPKDAEPGAKLHRVMRKGVNDHDRVILVCSKASLVRPGVLNEIQETLQREARDGGAEYLIPIKIDDYVHEDWAPSDPTVKQTVLDRVIADFRNTDENAAHDPAAKTAATAKFEEQLSRLLAALRKAKVQPYT